MKKVASSLKDLGFQKTGKYFSHPACEYFIEFVTPPVTIGKEPIQEFEHRKTKFGTIKMLTPTDCIKDRLAAYYHWNDRQSLEQAALIYSTIPKQIDLKDIKDWSKQEGHVEKFQCFIKKIGAA